MKRINPQGKHDGFPCRAFAAALAVLALGHWLGTQALEILKQKAAFFEEQPLALALFAGILVSALSVFLHRHHDEHPRPSKLREKMVQFTLAVGVLVSAFWVVAGLEHWLEHGPLHLAHHRVPFAVACLILLGVMQKIFRRLQAETERPRDVRPKLQSRDKPVIPLKALIVFISPPNQKISFSSQPATDGWHVTVHFPTSGDRQLLGTGHLERDIREVARELARNSKTGMDERFNWQPLLRALRGHDELREVILLGSESERGSHRHLPDCARFLSAYLPPTCRVMPFAKALDFTNFNQLVDELRGIIKKDLGDLPKNQIAIDVTGGTVTASIAGAATTMNLDSVFQYVNTNPPHDTITFDVMHEGGAHLH